MKMVLLVYNASIEEEVRKCAKDCGLSKFTKAHGLLGRGNSSDPHLGTHIWPSTNSMIIIVCDDERARQLTDKIKKLKEKFKKSGVKSFTLPVEEEV